MSIKITIADTTRGKTFKVLLWVIISGAVGQLIAYLTDNQAMLGIYAPVVNVILVFLKNLADREVKN